MKKILFTLTVTALAFALPASGFAATKKAEKPAEKTAETAKPAEQHAAAALPYQGVVDTVDTGAKKFTTKSKEGKVQTYTITDKTTILKDDAPAKVEDITIGETVRGTRLKTAEGQWEAVKVTIGKKAVAEEKATKKK